MTDRLTPPDLAQRATAEAIDHADLMAHGLDANAEHFARLPDDRRMPEGAALVYVVLSGCVCIGALAGWLARGWWG